MEFSPVTKIILMLVALLVVLRLFLATKGAKKVRRRGTLGSPGPGAAGAIYEMLNEDKRRAIEIIVEEKAAARDPETADDIPRDSNS